MPENSRSYILSSVLAIYNGKLIKPSACHYVMDDSGNFLSPYVSLTISICLDCMRNFTYTFHKVCMFQMQMHKGKVNTPHWLERSNQENSKDI